MQEAFSRTERESSVAVFLSTRKEYCPFLCFPHSSINAGVPFLPHLVTRSHLIYFQQLGIGTWPLNSHFHNVWRWWHCSRLLQVPLQQHTPPHLVRERIVSIFSENYLTYYTGSNTRFQIPKLSLMVPVPDRDKTPSISRDQGLTQTSCCEIASNSQLHHLRNTFESLLGHSQEGESLISKAPSPTICTGSSVCRTTKAAAP